MADPYAGEITIPLPHGGSLRCGEGTVYNYGDYLRICDAEGNELVYWAKQEWADEPEQVIGAVFCAAIAQSELLANLLRLKEQTDDG